MKIPEIVNHETTFYTFTLWPKNGGMGTSSDRAYKTRRTVYQAVANAFNKDGGKTWKDATIRRETVWIRNENTEISESDPIDIVKNLLMEA